MNHNHSLSSIPAIDMYICTYISAVFRFRLDIGQRRTQRKLSLTHFLPAVLNKNKYLRLCFYLGTMEDNCASVNRIKIVKKLSKLKYLKNSDSSFFHG